MAKKKFVPAIDLLIPSIVVIKDNLLTYFVLAVVPLLLYIYGSSGYIYTPGGISDIDPQHTSIQALGMLLSIVFFAPLAYARTKTARGKLVSPTEAISKGLQYFWRLVGLSILTALLVLGGLLLFIIPGIIMIRRYFLASYYLIDQDLSIRESMRASAKDSKANPFAIYGVLGVVLLFGLFGSISIVSAVLSVTISFLYSVAPALRYHEFRGRKLKS